MRSSNYHNERFNRASHSDALREMQLPIEQYCPTERTTVRKVIATLDWRDAAAMAAALVLPLVAAAVIL